MLAELFFASLLETGPLMLRGWSPLPAVKALIMVRLDMLLTMMTLGFAIIADQAVAPVAPGLVPEPMFVEVEKDPITDQVSAFAVARAEDARLSVGCAPDEFKGVRVKLEGRAWFAGENRFTPRIWVKHRFDEMRPRRSRWTTENGAAYLRSRRGVQAFLGWLAAAERVVVRAEDVEGRELDFIFTLDGSRAAIRKMLRVCGH